MMYIGHTVASSAKSELSQTEDVNRVISLKCYVTARLRLLIHSTKDL